MMRQREPRKIDPGFLEWLRTQGCACGCLQAPPCDAAHLKAGSLQYQKPWAGSAKPDDRWALPLKHEHHMQQHDFGDELGWWAKHGVKDPFALCIKYYARYGGDGGSPKKKSRKVKARKPREQRAKIRSKGFPKQARRLTRGVNGKAGMACLDQAVAWRGNAGMAWHDFARLGPVRFGRNGAAGRGQDARGRAGVVARGTMCRGSFWRGRRGGEWLDLAGQALRGVRWPGVAGHGRAGGAWNVSALLGMAGEGMQGRVCFGQAGEACSASVWRGMAGEEGRGTERNAGPGSVGFGRQGTSLRGEARTGRRGAASRDTAGRV